MRSFVMFTLMMFAGVMMYAQSNNVQPIIAKAKAAAIQNGCFDDVGPALHGTATGAVDYVKVPCGPAITGLAPRVFLYAPTPCPPNQICIQVIVPIAEVIFGCDGQPDIVTCLDNPIFP